AATDERGIELVGDLSATLAHRQYRLCRDTNRLRQLRDVDHITMRQPHRLLDDVLQLANVAGPSMSAQTHHRFFGEPGGTPRSRDEVRNEHGQILTTLAQRRHLDVNDAQSIEKV